MKAKKPAAPAGKPAVTLPAAGADPALALAPAPPAGRVTERLAWAEAEADRQRESVQKISNEMARVNLATIAIIAASDIERALANADIAAASAFRELIGTRLADTRWRLNWLAERKAAGGDFALGVMLLHGILEERDAEAACRRFAAAWKKGFLEAAFRHARCIESQRPQEALSLLQLAADARHAAASEQLGRRCLEASPPDGECAATRLGMAASAGRPSAKSLLGWLYAQGIGTPRDMALALSLYVEAAAAGDLPAKNNLGELYETGRGVERDPRRAAENYRQAAEAGFAPAQFNLGRLYAGGVGVERDVGKAREWLREALKGGIQPSQQLLDWLDQQEARN